MTLQARLDRIKAGFEKEAPAEALAVMHRVTADLRGSGIAEGVIGEGKTAPEFSLADSLGRVTSLASLRAEQPLVLTFFRGNW